MIDQTRNSAALAVHDIHFSFSDSQRTVPALRGVSFDVNAGEFFVILGPSGCGKTTTLRAVAGLIRPGQGEIRLGDRLLFSTPEAVNLNPKDRNVSFVFQNIAMYPNMTVRQNLEFPLKIRKEIPKSERESIIEGVSTFLQIQHLMHRYPRQISGGELQRAALGRAMVRSPDLFLMDEPISNLDADLRREIRTHVKKVQRALGTTTLYVTHDQKEAMTIADKIAVFMAGEVRQIGTPLELYERPRSLEVAEFMGETPMNVFVGELVSEADTIFFLTEYARFRLDQSIARKLRRAGRKTCVLGIRPEFIRLERPGEGDVDARVGYVQDTGPSRLIYVSLGAWKPVLVEQHAVQDTSFDSGRVGLRLSPDKLNVFTTAGDRIDL